MPMAMPTKIRHSFNNEIWSKNASTYLAEQSIMDHVMRMMVETEIPKPTDPTSPLYKILVRKIRKKLRTSDRSMDYLTVEVKARQMARWVELMAAKAATKSLSNIQARKLITPTNEDIPIEELVSDNEEDEDRENIFIEKLANNSVTTSPPFGRTGQRFSLLGEGGKKITVEALKSDHNKKALITKELSHGELESWIIQMRDKEQLKSTEAMNSIKLPNQVLKKNQNNSPNKNAELRPRNIDEWKAFAHLKQMEVQQWKKRIETIDSQNLPENQDYRSELTSDENKPSTPQKQKSQQEPTNSPSSHGVDLDKVKENSFTPVKKSRSNTPGKRITSKSMWSKVKENNSAHVTLEPHNNTFKIRKMVQGDNDKYQSDSTSIRETNQNKLQLTVSSKPNPSEKSHKQKKADATQPRAKAKM